MQEDLASTYKPGDRVALVGMGALLGMQIRRMAITADVAMFYVLPDAMSWLDRP